MLVTGRIELAKSPLPIAATFSKDPAFWGGDFYPRELLRGDGCRVLGDDGKWYVDWVSALGANLLGYPTDHDEWDRFNVGPGLVLFDGVGFSLPHVLERQVAEKLARLLGDHVPGWSPDALGVRFGLSGTDATTMAIRLARAVTGRDNILSFGYHGWADWSVAATPPAWGVPMALRSLIREMPFNDLQATERLLQATGAGAVILEQPMEDPLPGYYAGLRKLCNEYGALLILDEVVTGLRWALGGAAEYYGAEPDIVCMGKSLGNGVPISAIVGRREYFDWFERTDPVFVSSTHFGNALSLAAADTVLDVWNQDGVDHLWEIGDALMRELQDAGYTVIGHGPRSLLQFASPSERAYFIVGMRDRGILMNRPNIPNLAHTELEVSKTVKAATEVKAEIDALGADGLETKMAGKLPRVLFERR